MSIITTFETQCRSLASTTSPDENCSRFIVGTLSPTASNFIYLFEYKDDNNSLAKVSFKFPFGEVWHLQTPNNHSQLMSAVTGEGTKRKISIYRLPQEIDNPIEDDYMLSEKPIENIFDILEGDESSLVNLCHWHPDNGDKVLTCEDYKFQIWDVEHKKEVQKFSISNLLDVNCNGKVCDLRWSSLFNCNVIAAAIDSKIYGFDTRVPDNDHGSICWLIEDEKCNRIRSIDFNPNSQYYLASGGDDCRCNFWDLRKTYEPALHIQTHTHWIWSIRYNPYHDQLVLSASSDARAALLRVQSIASEAFSQPVDDLDDDNDDGHDEEKENEELKADYESDILNEKGGDDDMEDDENINYNLAKTTHESCHKTNDKASISEPHKAPDEDGVIKIYEEHDDSVYAAEWATDPWIFATLGLESRLIINKVPKSEKFNILFR